MGILFVLFSFVAQVQASEPSAEQILQNISSTMIQIIENPKISEVITDKNFAENYEEALMIRDLQNLNESVINPLLQKELSAHDVALLERLLSNLSCRYFFEQDRVELVSLLNQLHVQSHGDWQDFYQMQDLIKEMKAYLVLIEGFQVEGPSKENLVTAASDFLSEIQNLIFHLQADFCVKLQHREAQSFEQLMMRSVGLRSPQTRFRLFEFYHQNFSAFDQESAAEILEIFDRIEGLLSFYQEKSSDKILKSQKRVERIISSLQNFSTLNFEASEIEIIDTQISKPLLLQWGVFARIFRASGGMGEVFIPVYEADWQQGKGEVDVQDFITALRQAANFDLINDVGLQMRIVDPAVLEPVAFVDFQMYWQPLATIRVNVRYFPYDLDFNRNDLYKINFFPHDTMKLSRYFFLEDLSEVEPVPDEIKGLNEKGEYVTLGYDYREVQKEHDRTARSLHLAVNQEDSKAYRYLESSKNRLSFRLNLSLTTPYVR